MTRPTSRPSGNQLHSGVVQLDMPGGPAERAERLPPHLAVLAIGGLSLAGWAGLALLAQAFLRAI